jgi:MFS family permease
MHGAHTLRIPPKRPRLLGIFFGCVLVDVLGVGFMIGIGRALLTGLLPVFAAFWALVFVCGAVILPFVALFALWAFVRLVLNLPAVILTPTGIINHSIVYHVVVPWSQIEQLVRLTPGRARQWPPRFGRMNCILVVNRDDEQLKTMQQPFTRMLLCVFSRMRPYNISTAVTSGTQDAVWARLQRYVHETAAAAHITFDTL